MKNWLLMASVCFAFKPSWITRMIQFVLLQQWQVRFKFRGFSNLNFNFLSWLYLAIFLFPLKALAAFFLLNADDLAEMKIQVLARNPAFESEFLNLIKEADLELSQGPYSVMEKTLIPPSGNKHDYISLARYYWPDPDQKDGVPYFHKDCEINPDIFKNDYDYAKKNKMVRGCIQLCLAYYLTQDEKYASHAILIVNTWFLNPDSCMNPNLNFAQVQPGISNKNKFGVIEGHTFPYLFESLNFLAGSPSWTNDIILKMEDWAVDYLEWLLTSTNGIQECYTLNNHASWYDMQVIYFALYTRQNHLAAEHIEDFTFQKLDTHFATNYSQPHEMVRKKNFYYSLFNLQALFNCALLGSFVEKDLWEVQKGREGTLRKGLDFLLSYLEEEKNWQPGKIELSDFTEITSLLLIVSTIYPNSHYLKLYEKVEFLTRDLNDVNRQFPCRILRLIYSRPFNLKSHS